MWLNVSQEILRQVESDFVLQDGSEDGSLRGEPSQNLASKDE